MDTLTDIKELVERAKNYDTEAFGRIYDLYFDKIFNYAYYKVGNRHEAEDIAEQVFLKALEKISGFEWRGAPFSSWLFRIASNLVIDFYRAGKYEMVDISCEEDSLYVGGCGPEESAMREHDRASLVDAIKTLTEEQQQVIIFRFILGMSNEEVAEVIGKNVGAVKALRHRAINALGKTLGRE
ncbi:MAG: sigma-70 family RNA polymerase sigma factor [Actinobacteria bacterium]|nr:sigma-70 family RNA polymerase sigma factor [Actinomycetota bacterium]